MLGCSDEEQLAHAVDRERTILTHNRVHFERLNEEYFQVGKPHHGIIISVQRSPYEIARRVARIMNKVTAAEMENQIRYI